MLFVCIAGLIGNIAAIFSFSKQRKRSQKNFYTFMLYLAVYDLLYILVSIFVFVLPQFSSYYKDNGPWMYVLPWGIPIGQVSMTGGIYFTMVICLERYLTVCHPFYMYSRDWKSNPIVFGIIAFSVLYNIPKFLETSTKFDLCYINKTLTENVLTTVYSSEICEHEIRQRLLPQLHNLYSTNDTTNATTHHQDVAYDQFHDQFETIYRYYTLPSEMRLNSLYVQLYAVYMNFFVNGFFPFSTLIFLNILIIKELQKLDPPSTPLRNNTGKTKHDHDIDLIRVFGPSDWL